LAYLPLVRRLGPSKVKVGKPPLVDIGCQLSKREINAEKRKHIG
jgi:hypothetical protein